MDIRIKTSDYELTPAIQGYLEERIASIEKFLSDDADRTRCEAEIGRDAGRPRHGKNIWFAEMRILIPGRASIYARNNSESLNGAIDDVKGEIEGQLLRERKLHIRLYRKSGAFAKRMMRLGR